MNHEILIETLKESDKESKLEAMNQLIEADDSVVDAVISELLQVDAPTVFWALEGIDHYEVRKIRAAFSDSSIIRDTAGFKRWHVLAYIKILIAHQDLSVHKLLRVFPTEHPETNALIVFILGAIGDRQAIVPLTQRIVPSAISEKIRVITALGHFKAVNVVDDLHAYIDHKELTVPVALALGRIGDIRSLNPLIEQFRRDPVTAHVTGAALSKLGRVAVEPLISILNDPDAEPVYAFTAEILGLLGDERSIPALIELVKHTTSDLVKRNAIVALGKLEARSAFDLLTESVLHPSGLNDGFAAIEALPYIDNDKAFEFFTTVIENVEFDIELRFYAMYGFRLLKKLHNIKPLLDAVSDPDARIRNTAVTQLAILKDERARATLELATKDADWHTRVWAIKGLQDMDAHE